MSTSMEKVFIAWGANQSLAQAVSQNLSKHGFEGIVGGENPSNMHIGTQVFSQINQCTRAIILLEIKYKESDNPFSSNLMFEWGYLASRLDSQKLHIFLLDVSMTNLPSDLQGIWANEINKSDRNDIEIAEEIVQLFISAASKPIIIDKMDVFSKWTDIKRNIGEYHISPMYSEIESAHYILHSTEACYGYMEEEIFLSLLEMVKPSSSILQHTLQVVKANLSLFIELNRFTSAVSFELYTELESIFESKFDYEKQDKNLHLWLSFFCFNRLGLLNSSMMRMDDLDIENRLFLGKKAEECFQKGLNVLHEIVALYPQEQMYVKLHEGYTNYSLYLLSKRRHDEENAAVQISVADKLHKEFYIYFKQNYPNEGYLIKHFGTEYYISCVLNHLYINEPIKKKIAKESILSFLERQDNEASRGHVALKRIKYILDNNEDL